MSDHPSLTALSLGVKAALLSGANVWQTRTIGRLGIPSVWTSDGPHGLRKQAGDADHLGIGQSEQAVCFPTAATLANSWDESLLTEVGAALGREAIEHGVQVLLGPGLNIKRSPLGGRNFEYLSEDPELSGRLAAAYVRGVQSEGVAATPKHFAGNSQELDRLVSDSVIDERTLREIYLTAFEIVVREAGPWALMSSYNRLNGTYTHEHRQLLADILRDEWGFDGAVVSDWGGVNDPVASVAAGGTLQMPSPGFVAARAVTEAVESGALAESDVDARVGEILQLVQRTTARSDRPVVDAEAHHVLARRAAAAGAVLLRNVDGVLPLAAGTRVALVGDFARTPRYQGAGSSLVTPTRLTTLLGDVPTPAVDLIGYAAGYRRDGTTAPELLAEIADAAHGAEVIVLALAVPEADESEGRDRPHLRLPQGQLDALAAAADTGVPVVAVIAGGGPVETPWLGRTAALLHGHLGGQAGAEGLWDVLTGVVEPGGRLAETHPRVLADDATATRFPAPGPTAEYREGPLVRYRHHASAGIEPAFPFGFGLGYTTFGYEGLVVTDTGACFTVRNTGERRGAEVAQLYVQRTGPSAVVRPALELKGFEKLWLDPGEEQVVTIPFGQRTFRFFDVRTHDWQVEAGQYRVHVGPHSMHLPLRADLTVAGTVPEGSLDPALAPYRRGDGREIPAAAFAALLGRPLPPSAWDVPPLTENTPLHQLRQAPSWFGRRLFDLLDWSMRRAEATGRHALEVGHVFHGPFRTLHTMTGGTVPTEATAAVLTIVNGRPLRGIGGLVVALVRGGLRERCARRAFDAAARAR
ncbi:glycoside hydrolase family 3 N-terminal domain-containing protein [Kytococcus sedentarius]|uniref:glycoside hydrolase family 3 N-terminal domain-containing protein n=1 Tax=Kytococcus sedentarius TaxID=1276 RepID=UPI0035BC11F7